MYQFFIELAELRFLIKCRYEYCYQLCKDYLVDGNEYDFEIYVSDEMLNQECALSPEYDAGYIESLGVYRLIAESVPMKKRFLMHGAVITFEDQGYMFTALSGTGKTTHIRLWKKYLKKHVDIVNGDKPLLYCHQDVYAYGTPWCGKEGWQKNRKAKLNGICFIQRGSVNCIRRLEMVEVVSLLMKQVYLSKDKEVMFLILECIDFLLKKVPFYLLECDMSKEAVRCSFEGLTGLSFNDWSECNEN